MSYYIQRKGQNYLETVDETLSRRDAKHLLTEYQMSDPSAHYYISSRACMAWRFASLEPVCPECQSSRKGEGPARLCKECR